MEGRRRSSVVQVTRADDGVRRVDDAVIRRMSVANPDIPQIHQEAKNATANVMEGYDLSVMNSFYAFTPFKNKYGDQPDPEEGGNLISAQWQTGLGNGVQVCPLVA
jgi:hypothetical protein